MLSTESAKRTPRRQTAHQRGVIDDAERERRPRGASGWDESVRNIGAAPMHWVAGAVDATPKWMCDAPAVGLP